MSASAAFDPYSVDSDDSEDGATVVTNECNDCLSTAGRNNCICPPYKRYGLEDERCLSTQDWQAYESKQQFLEAKAAADRIIHLIFDTDSESEAEPEAAAAEPEAEEEDNGFEYEDGVEYTESFLATLQRNYVEGRTADFLCGNEGTFDDYAYTHEEQLAMLTEQGSLLTPEDSHYLLHCWKFDAMGGMPLLDLKHWYIHPETAVRINDEYYAQPIGGRKRMRCGQKFPIHRVCSENRQWTEDKLVAYNNARK